MSVPIEYVELVQKHSWIVPDSYNVASDVCDKHAPDKLAMIWADDLGQDRRIYWKEIQDRSNQYANFLTSLGVERGDRISVMLPPGLEAAASLIAILKLGAIGIPLSALWSNESLKFRLVDARARILLTNSSGVGRNLDAPGVRVLSIDEGVSGEVTQHSENFTTVDTSPDDPALIYYTSGSTGNPKGVVSPHRGLIGHNEFEYCQDLKPGELSYWMGDWSWGIYKVLGPWRYGAVNVVYHTNQKYDPEGLLEILSRYEVTNIFLNPTGLRLMMNAVPDAGSRYPQAFRICCSANEPLGEPERVWFEEQFGIPVLENYGMTEAYPMVGNFPSVPRKTGSMGLPVPGWHVEILDDQGSPVPPNTPGEICLRARSNPQYPLGYWGMEDLTKNVFGGEWFHTKDVAYRDEDGYIFYVGRKDDVIKSSGYRISPFEIEQACEQHWAVQAAGVIGVPDEVRGQVVKAYIVPDSRVEATDHLATQIAHFVKQEHSKFGYPKVIEFVEKLPESQSGKIARAKLREMHHIKQMYSGQSADSLHDEGIHSEE